MPEVPEVYDVTIVGGGPAGMFAAYYAGFRKLKVKILDSLGELGGQITALYPDKAIFDVAGFPSISGRDLVADLQRQMQQFNPTLALGEQGLELIRKEADNQWLLRTDQGEHLTRSIIVSSGIGLFTPRRLGNAVFEAYEGRGLSYVMTNPAQYHGKRVAIVGGGDSAVDWANHLAPHAEIVYLIHRRDEFRAHESSVELVRSHTAIKAPAQIVDMRDSGGHLEEIVLDFGPDRERETLRVDAVLAFLGFVSSPGPIAEWGLTLEKNLIVINQRCETNLPGIYAIGDCAWFEGKAKLIAVGFGEAATAVNNLAVYIDPKKSVFPGHSTKQKEAAGS
jgi:ferredoxin/flavodoxin---NADP+ reductase